MTNVSIGGNVTDSVVVLGNDNFVVKIGDVNGGVVTSLNLQISQNIRHAQRR